MSDNISQKLSRHIEGIDQNPGKKEISSDDEIVIVEIRGQTYNLNRLEALSLIGQMAAILECYERN